MFVNFKKIIFTLVFFLMFYVFYQIIVIRSQYVRNQKDEVENENNNKEPFESRPYLESSKVLDLPLKEYVIMSSWNSAVDYDGIVSLEVLEKVVQRGYRFLDMEIYLTENEPHVGFSSEKSFDTVESMPVSFLDVCDMLLAKAFFVSNKLDPLLLHLRIKSRNTDIYDKIANILKMKFNERLYTKQITGETTLAELQNKVVIIVDRNYAPHLKDYECKSCSVNLNKQVAVYSGTPTFQSLRTYEKLDKPYTPLEVVENGRTNVEKWQMVSNGIGDFYTEENKPDFYNFVLSHSVQIIPHKVASKDEALQIYEMFFQNNGKRAFVPMAVAHDYIEFEAGG